MIGLFWNDRTILFLVILLDKTVLALGRSSRRGTSVLAKCISSSSGDREIVAVLFFPASAGGEGLREGTVSISIAAQNLDLSTSKQKSSR